MRSLGIVRTFLPSAHPGSDGRRKHARIVAHVLLWFTPWAFRRRVLNRFFGCAIHPTARIGFSVLVPDVLLRLDAGARVGHLSFAHGMDEVRVGEESIIGNLNWIFAVPTGAMVSDADPAAPARQTSLILGRHAALVGRHVVDCSDRVLIDDFAAIGGWGTHILTHGVNLAAGKVHARPITVGRSCLTGARCVLLLGAVLPPYCALGANSTLRTAETEEHSIYSGVPATRVGAVAHDAGWFTRDVGVIS